MKKVLKKLELRKVTCANLIKGGAGVDRSKVKRPTVNEECNGGGEG